MERTMAQVVTEDGLMDEDTLTWRLWREDIGESWSIIHELTDGTGRVVRRDTWVNFKGGPTPAAELKPGDV